ncbi:hypothetical protein [Dyadobacter sp. Leaf189]|uniref:hypothetical protein n=1 Tax=Dyadobacter sp. Leaf189 TaxID=1736295 RepID=UPI0006F6A956|nr:hypothetical protein [Dyadobacter sp. Leaf189]KQS26979.1 hypothetical protein ASG33_20800 [Dyadobacter sp. Leaf189]
MRNPVFPSLLTLFALITFLISCNNTAGDSKEAAEFLTAAPKWKIDEIRVNDAVTFENGKMMQQFGGIDFQRYMEIVEIRRDGNFEGVFKGESKPFKLQWKLNENKITVGLPGASPSPGDWTIAPGDVDESSFIMKTQSTAYDYPNVTKIALKFKSLK